MLINTIEHEGKTYLALEDPFKGVMLDKPWTVRCMRVRTLCGHETFWMAKEQYDSGITDLYVECSDCGRHSGLYMINQASTRRDKLDEMKKAAERARKQVEEAGIEQRKDVRDRYNQ